MIEQSGDVINFIVIDGYLGKIVFDHNPADLPAGGIRLTSNHIDSRLHYISHFQKSQFNDFGKKLVFIVADDATLA